MNRWRSWLNAVGLGANRARLEREMSDEMQIHIEMEAAHLESQGVPSSEARRRAIVAFGGAERFKEEARDGMVLRWANDFAADARFAFRSLRRTPAFSAVAVLALAVGIGATSTVFGLVDSIAFRKLPVSEPERLVAVFGSMGDATLLGSSYSTGQELRRTTQSFSDVAAFTESAVTVAVSGAAQPAVAWAMHTSDNYFALLGLRAELGRFYGSGELDRPLVVLSHDFWQSTLGGEPEMVGRTIYVNGAKFTVIGVAPQHFSGTRLFTSSPAVWIPVGMYQRTIPGIPTLLADGGPNRFHVIARLRGNVTIAQGQAEVDRVAERLSASHPQLRGLRLTLLPNASAINPWLAPHARIELFGTLLFAAVCLVLLIACANVASLLLARMSARHTEIGVRLALGASRWRLLRQFLTESLVLALLGIAAAIPIAWMAIPAWTKLWPPLDFSSSTTPIVDARIVLVALIAGLSSAVVFGVSAFAHTLSTSKGLQARFSGGPSRKGERLRRTLVVAQVALSVFVLAAAGLFARALQAARAVDVGFDARNAVAFTLDPSLLPDYALPRTEAFYQRLLAELAALRGVRSVARATSVPLDGSNINMRVEGVAADGTIVDENYFATMGFPIVAGRVFQAADTNGIEPVLVNEVLARKLAYGGGIVGRRVQLGSAKGPVAEVVGVARATASRHLADAPRPLVWLSIHRDPKPRSTIVIRTGRTPQSLFPDVRAIVRSLHPRLPNISLRTLQDRVAPAYSAAENAAFVGAALGFLAAVLAATGIFGIVSYTVSRRTREIGVRIALGAQPGHILRLVTGSVLRLTALGIAIGSALILALPGSMSRILYGVSPHDPVVLAVSAVVFIGIAAVASVLPARKALRLDPARALRVD